MAEVITYSLRSDHSTSDAYFRAVSAFVDEWMPRALTATHSVILGFRRHRMAMGQRDRSDEECAFELLVLGVTLREHGGEAVRLPRLKAWALIQLIRAQRRWPRYEPKIKKLRGWLGWLGRRLERSGSREGRDLDRLLTWLRANGQETRAERLSQWQAFLTSSGPAARDEVMRTALALAQDFALAARRTLGQYTRNVEYFLAETAPRYQKRYDAELVSRMPVEYHLSMVGVEVLSRANRGQFAVTQRRIVIVPPCMRAKPDGVCKAVATPLGARCQFCTPGCNVSAVTRLGEQRGFEVYMIPDQLRRIGSEAGRAAQGLGMVGVSCALTNWSGGWDADAIGVAAQGVPLDYVGCNYHWHDHGIPTAVNLRELERITTATCAADSDAYAACSGE